MGSFLRLPMQSRPEPAPNPGPAPKPTPPAVPLPGWPERIGLDEPTIWKGKPRQFGLHPLVVALLAQGGGPVNGADTGGWGSGVRGSRTPNPSPYPVGLHNWVPTLGRTVRA